MIRYIARRTGTLTDPTVRKVIPRAEQTNKAKVA